MANPRKFLRKYSGKIVGVGDIFDHYRSSIAGETMDQYLARTSQDWMHISDFIVGNHDAVLLEKHYKDVFKPVRIYRNGPVLALHGHQLKFTDNQAQMLKYENKWATNKSVPSLFWDFEEWCCKTFNKYFMLHGKKAFAQALVTLEEVEKKGLLDDKVDTVITGHTHLPFDVRLYYKGKRYRVVNCGSSLHGKVFKPVYVRRIDKWFVSDLHLGTAKSELD